MKQQGQLPENQAVVSEKEQEVIGQLQQEEYMQQEPTPTMAMEYGNSQTGEMSQMNQWQTQPAYDGAWQSPQEYEPYVEQFSAPDAHQYQGEVPLDPQQYRQDQQDQQDQQQQY